MWRACESNLYGLIAITKKSVTIESAYRDDPSTRTYIYIHSSWLRSFYDFLKVIGQVAFTLRTCIYTYKQRFII